MNKISADQVLSLNDKNLAQLLDISDDLETKLRDVQADLRDARFRMTAMVIHEGWMHCLTLNKSAVRRQLHRNSR